MQPRNDNHLGMYVTKCREQRGWSPAELSRQSGIPYGTIRNIEQNLKPVKPKEETLRKLAAVFGPETHDLLFALAGYGIPISESIEERNHIVDSLLAARPGWRSVLHKVSARPPADQDHALKVLQVYLALEDGGGDDG